MIGRVIGALVGRELDRGRNESGVKGALVGALGVSVLRRMGPLGMVLGGAYVARKMYQRSRADRHTAPDVR
ncbi:hypothetical protein [Sphingomonas sp.]|uniref:hypothetical protein n=1 Tax=Sphingomonas sp. TaxID=28214 RepID=UPI003B3A0437